MANKQLENVSFDFVRYANCWEDPRLLLESLQGRNEKYMSIASAGDNSFSLLTLDPEMVVAFDISKVQLYLTELKKVAISKMEREEYLAFAGFTGSDSRLDTFRKLRNDLPADCRQYWEAHVEVIEMGIIFNGKFEAFFRKFAHEILPGIHSKEKVRELLRPKKEQEQVEFFENEWNTPEWKAMFPVVFNKDVFGEEGRDPEFMKHVKTDVPTHIRESAATHYKSTFSFENPFLRFFLMGNFGDALPHYVQEENYNTIRERLGRLKLHEGLLESGLNKYPGFTRFNLSNIFEYMDVPLFRQVAHEIIDKSGPEAEFSYWNLMIDRRISLQFAGEVEYRRELSKELSQKDHGYFYKAFITDRKK